MLTRILDQILGPHSKISVLRVLFAQDSLTGREIARRAGLSPRAASLALKDLVRTGIVHKHAVGGAHQYAISRERYLVYTVLGNLFAEEEDLTGTIGHRIIQTIGQGKCVSVALFGSYARNAAKLGSDMDVLCLLKDSYRVAEVAKLLEEKNQKFFDLFGIHLSPYVIGAGEFVDRFRKGDKLMKNMMKEARVIAGKPLAEVIVDESEAKADQVSN